jgi:hypothetical protein
VTYTENAKGDYDAAEALVVANKLEDARAAFVVVIKKFTYSRWAKEAELRIAQLDDRLGRPEGNAELAAWARNHPTDERARVIASKARTVGDTTCRTDADCTTTTQRDCCECCSSGPYATSKQWLTWQTSQCAAQKCGLCTTPCPLPGNISVAARCVAGACTLVSP